MTKKKYLKKLERALKDVSARERADLVAYYDELIEDAFERGKSAKEVFSDLESPDAVAENYLKERAAERGVDKKRGHHVRNAALVPVRIVYGFILAVLAVVLAALIFSFAVTGFALAVAGVCIFIISFGVLISGHTAIFFTQMGEGLLCGALAILSFVLVVLLVRAMSAMFRRSGRAYR